MYIPVSERQKEKPNNGKIPVLMHLCVGVRLYGKKAACTEPLLSQSLYWISSKANVSYTQHCLYELDKIVNNNDFMYEQK